MDVELLDPAASVESEKTAREPEQDMESKKRLSIASVASQLTRAKADQPKPSSGGVQELARHTPAIGRVNVDSPLMQDESLSELMIATPQILQERPAAAETGKAIRSSQSARAPNSPTQEVDAELVDEALLDDMELNIASPFPTPDEAADEKESED